MRIQLIALAVSVATVIQAAPFPSPDDWRDETIYQIFTDRFFDGDPSNNNQESSHGSPYAPTDSTGIHGGDFKGIQQKLDYIKSLGASAIWINPIPLNIPGNSAYHGYAAQDFYALAPHWGTMTDLTNMVAAAHARGIKVILDVVVNHSGDLISGDSGYPNFRAPPAGYVMHYNDPGQQHAPPFNITNATPPAFMSIFHTNGVIQNFGDTQQVVLGELLGLDDFATETDYVRTNMMNIYTNWVGRADFDGFRVDTAKHVDYGFWQYWCPQLHQFGSSIGKSNLFMFGEAFDGDESVVGSYTGTEGGGPAKLDSMLDYPLYFTINPVFGGAYADTKRIEDHYNSIAANYDSNAWYRLVTFLDNHDNARFLSSGNANNDTNHLAVALEFLYTSRGIPCMYYGTEQAFNGGGDPFDREDMFAGQFEQGPSLGDNFNETHPLFQLIARLNNFRRLYPSLRRGVHNNLWQDPSGPGLFAFARVLSNEEVFVVFNTDSFTQTLTNRPTTYSPGSVLVNLLDTNETIVVSASSGTNTTPQIAVPSMRAKIFIAQLLMKPLDPVVISQSPAHAMTNVSTAAAFVLRFSKPMDTNLVQTAFSVTPPSPGVFAWSALHDTMTFTPSASGWPAFTTNVVQLATSAMDSVSSNTLYAPFETYFVTYPNIPNMVAAGATVMGGNGNGMLDPNECNFLNLSVQNLGGGNASNVNATLTTSTPGVTVMQATSSYPELAPGNLATNATPFQISTSPAFGCTPIALALTMTYSGGTNIVTYSFGGDIFSQSSGVSIVPGTTDMGNHFDDGTTTIALPFNYTFSGQTFSNVTLSSNGNLQFLSSNAAYENTCLPYSGFNYAIVPFWDDLRTDRTDGGIFTSISGVAPDRIFNIEWRAVYFANNAPVNFEVRLYENRPRVDIVYGTLNGDGNGATVGIQNDTGSQFNQFECNTGGLSSGLMLTYQSSSCIDGGGQCVAASFSASPTNGTAPLLVTFDDSSAGPITNRFWNFGDGQTTNTTVAGLSYTYTAPATNTVTLVVSGAGGVSTNTRLNYIVVTPAPLTPFQTWQFKYFGCTNCVEADAAADPDGDGQGNWAEFSANTNPTNNSSAFQIISVVRQEFGINIVWRAGAGTTNVVQVANGSDAGSFANSFGDLSPPIVLVGTGDITTNYVDIGGATNSPARYYRVTLGLGNAAVDLRGYWSFDEGSGAIAFDGSGNGNTGAVAGAAWTGGMNGSALYFDGTDQVIISNSASLNPTGAITVAAWVNADGWFGNPRILEKGTDNQYRLLAQSGQLMFDVFGVTNVVTSLPSEGTWHHVAGTYDGSVMAIYVDGQQVAEHLASGPFPNTTNVLTIGNLPGSGNPFNHFSGVIDDVRIYGRALSSAEIMYLYQTGGAGNGAP